MSDEVLKKVYQMREGGWARLSYKMEQADIEDLQETKMWRGIAATLAFALLLIPLFKNFSENSFDIQLIQPRANELLVNQGTAVEVPHSVKGVHLYWLFMDEAEATQKPPE